MSRYLPWQSFNEFFVSIVYFVQGSAGIVGIASSLILREELGLDFYQMGLIGVAATLPWSIKPVFGLLTDLVPIGKFRRRPYLHLGPLMGFLGFIGIALQGYSFQSFFLFMIFANLGLSLTDVATDGFVVEESNDENVTRLQGITQASIRTASFITSFFSGLLIFAEILTPHQMYFIAAAFPLITFFASFFIKEKPVDKLQVFQADPEDSISTESTLAQYQTKNFDLSLFSKGYIISLMVIFTLIILKLAFGQQLDAYLAENLPFISGSYITVILWGSFMAWMVSYYRKLVIMGMASKMIFLAILFILLWRINPGTGSSMFFYVKDTLLINEKTLGFMNTIAQLGSIAGVFLAVKYFDKINLRKLLTFTVLLAALFSLSSFAITRPEYAEWIGSNWAISTLGTIIATPIYFLDNLFTVIISGGEWINPWATASLLNPIEHFLYTQSIIDEMIFMVAYIPLLKLAVLVCPEKAEATNYAIIASIMNIGLSLSGWLSGFFYNYLMGIYHPTLEVSAIEVDVIEILIWINIITSLMCLIVVPFLKTEEFKRG
ncbi:MAG: MFS transporter [Candidatus Gracilibacteria bacterium]|nr:MFS transporter [Candidatus Gracilibacteria bacterium]